MFLKLIKCVWNFNRFEIYLTVESNENINIAFK